MYYLNFFFRTLVVLLILTVCAFVFFGNHASASKPYLQVLNSDPANSKLRYEYGLKLLRNGDVKQAQKQLETAYEFDKKNVYINEALHSLLVNSPQIQSEIGRTLEIIAKRPDYASAWLHLASLYETTGQLEKADLARQAGENLRTI